MQNRQTQTWLSGGEYAQIEAEWQEQLELRNELKDKPSELKRYEEKLKEATMTRNRSDAYHQKGKKSAAYKLDSKCESLCEDAPEILQEIVAPEWEGRPFQSIFLSQSNFSVKENSKFLNVQSYH